MSAPGIMTAALIAFRSRSRLSDPRVCQRARAQTGVLLATSSQAGRR